MIFKTIYDENFPNRLKPTQKVVIYKVKIEIIIDANQQLKTFEKQTEDIFNKLPTNIRSVEALSVFKTMINNLFLDQASF